ncbi:atp phosphoribosyltransferase [Kluyveromyces marxianus]|uniref:Atp phosphoribosyltransferase n=1 Tax=Kluyveromyces marxianus TaxID=4911 RepID=A0ABX6EYZ7_KLUMA|nr:atp phosphoribosyltransferase [Kluyveromyces marxianus]
MDLVNHLSDKLLFAIPKKGRLYEKSVSILKGSDIKFHRSARLDIAISTNMPVALIFLPAADIPMFVGEERKSKGDIMDALKKRGAEDIMVFEISNCRV